MYWVANVDNTLSLEEQIQYINTNLEIDGVLGGDCTCEDSSDDSEVLAPDTPTDPSSNESLDSVNTDCVSETDLSSDDSSCTTTDPIENGHN